MHIQSNLPTENKLMHQFTVQQLGKAGNNIIIDQIIAHYQNSTIAHSFPIAHK